MLKPGSSSSSPASLGSRTLTLYVKRSIDTGFLGCGVFAISCSRLYAVFDCVIGQDPDAVRFTSSTACRGIVFIILESLISISGSSPTAKGHILDS